MIVPAHPHLQALLADAEAVRDEAQRLRDTLSPRQLTWRPEPDTWSVADCFEHLRKMDKAYLRVLPEALARAEPGGTEPYKPSLFARGFIQSVSPNPRFKLRAPRAVRPRAEAGADALDRFLDQQEALLELIRRADGRNLNTGRFASPLSSFVRFSLGEGLTALVRHQQRHTQQAQRLTERPDFPVA